MRARNIRSYHRPTRMEEALYLTARGATPLAGGTRLLAAQVEIPNVVDLSALDLAAIGLEDGDLVLGAMVTLQEAADSPDVHTVTGGLLAEACRAQAPSRMVRGMATLAGESVHAERDSEVVAALLVLNAVFTIAHPNGEVSEVPALRFLRNPQADLEGGALVRSILLARGRKGTALVRVEGSRGLPPLVAVAVTVTLVGDQCNRVRLAFTGLTTPPARVIEAEARLEGTRGTEKDLERCVKEAVTRAAFRDDDRAPAVYRRDVAGALLHRALREALSHARADQAPSAMRPWPVPSRRPPTVLPYFTSGRIEVAVNGEPCHADVEARSTLVDLLRGETLWSVRRGCETGECGACTVLIDGKPVCACLTLALRAEGRSVQTVEGLGSPGSGLHRVQSAFLETAAIGCGYCTPARELCTAALLEAVPDPSEAEARDALEGCSCRCTLGRRSGTAVSLAARQNTGSAGSQSLGDVRLARGRATFVDDVTLPRLLHARILHSPQARARILSIDTRPARAMPGVACVLTHEDAPRSSGEALGVALFEPTVLRLGERAAVVAAEDAELAQRACEAIRVDYESGDPPLPASAPDPGDTKVASRGSTSDVVVENGSLARGLAKADRVFEGTYRFEDDAPSSIEPHVAYSWLDEDERLNVRTASRSPFALRRRLSSLLALPENRIRVIPRPAAAGRDEAGIEDLGAALTLRTSRPVRIVREGSTLGPSQTVTVRSGLKEGRFTALELRVETNAGGAEALRSAGSNALSLYRARHARFEARAVGPDNLPEPLSTDRATRALLFALEAHVDEVATSLGEDPLEFRRRNLAGRDKEHGPGEAAAGQGVVPSGGCGPVLALGADSFGWTARRDAPASPGAARRGVGIALAATATSVPQSARVTLRLDEDGSFHLIAGHAALSAESGLARAAARALGVAAERVVVHVPDTDIAPRDTDGASAVTCVLATEKAVGLLLDRIRAVGARVLDVGPDVLARAGGGLRAPDGRFMTDAEVARAALEGPDASPLEAAAAQLTSEPAPAFSAVLAEVEVDTETGIVQVRKLVQAIDAGRVLDPEVAQARVEGAIARRVDASDVTAIFLAAGAEATPKPLNAIAGLGVQAAVANAIAAATGARVRDLPLSPVSVLNALQAVAAGGKSE